MNPVRSRVTHPRRVRWPRALISLVMTLAIASGLASCTNSDNALTQILGPHPDDALVQLATAADDEAAAMAETDPALSQLRAEQAEALFTEITRVCGTYPDDSVPQSCHVDRSESAEANPVNDAHSADDAGVTVAKTPADSFDRQARQLPDVPESSQALLVDQITSVGARRSDLVTAIKETASEISEATADNLPHQDRKRGETMANWEYQVGYAIDMVRAYSPHPDVIEASAQAADIRYNALATAGFHPGDLALSYDTTTELTEESADSINAELHRETSLEWKRAAAEATDEKWQYLSLLMASYIDSLSLEP